MFIQGDRIEKFVIPAAAIKSNLSIDIIEKINKFQWDEVSMAVRTCNTIEVTDFFKLKIDPYLLNKALVRFRDIRAGYIRKLNLSPDDKEKEKLNKLIGKVDIEIDYLESKNGKI